MQPLNRTKSEIRPLYNRMTPHGAVLSRSPMVSLIFPSLKDKIRSCEYEQKKQSKVRASTAVGKRPSARQLDIIPEEKKAHRSTTNNFFK